MRTLTTRLQTHNLSASALLLLLSFLSVAPSQISIPNPFTPPGGSPPTYADAPAHVHDPINSADPTDITPSGHDIERYQDRFAVLYTCPFPNYEVIWVKDVPMQRQSFQYGEASHWWWGRYPLFVTVYLPLDPAANTGRGIVGMISSSFGSQGDFGSGREAAVEGEVAKYIAQGYSFFQVRHGSKTDLREPTVMLPVPGFLASEIFDHIDSAIRWIKSNRTAFGLAAGSTNPQDWDDCLGITGGSSGAYLALRALNGDASTTTPVYYGSKVAVAAVQAPASDVLEYRFAGDNSWLCRFPEMFIHPNFPAIDVPAPAAPIFGNGPTPPSTFGLTEHSFFYNDIGGVPGSGYVPSNYAGTATTAWPELNYDIGTDTLTRPTNANYPPATAITYGGPPSTLYPTVPTTIQTFTFSNLCLQEQITAAGTGPSLLISGRDDPITPLFSAGSWVDKCMALNVPCTHVVAEIDSHAFMDVDMQHEQMYRRFFAANIPYPLPFTGVDSDGDGVPDSQDSASDVGLCCDSDGDGQSDFAEHLMNVAAGPAAWIDDPNQVFAITSATMSATDVTLVFTASTSLGNYRAQFSVDGESWTATGPALAVPGGGAGTAIVPLSSLPARNAADSPTVLLRIQKLEYAEPFTHLVQGATPIDLNAWPSGMPDDLYRVEAATHPVALVKMEMRRRTSAATINYMTAPVQAPPVFRGRPSTVAWVQGSTTEAEITAVASLPGSLTSGPFPPGNSLPLANRPNYYVIITSDDTGNLGIGRQTNTVNHIIDPRMPEDRGIEGHWFPMLSATGSTVKVKVDSFNSQAIADLIAGTTDPAKISFGVIPMPTLQDVMGGATNSATKNGDIISLIDPNTPDALHPSGTFVEALQFNATVPAWETTASTGSSFGLPSMGTSVPTGTIRLYPGEVIRLNAVADVGGHSPYDVLGHAPMHQINAYLPELSSFHGWCYPLAVNVRPQGKATQGLGRHCGLVSTRHDTAKDFYSWGEATFGPLSGASAGDPHDKAIFTPFYPKDGFHNSTSPFYAGDDHGDWLFATTESAHVRDKLYWVRPAPWHWYVNEVVYATDGSSQWLSAGDAQLAIDLRPGDLDYRPLIVHPGRGYHVMRFILPTATPDTFVWMRRVPYRR